ncbi:MAG: glutathione S-transferase [Alteromonadaceae bacterium]|jgi:glutathione S-transferase
MAITIYGVCASPFVRKVFVVAETLGLAFDNIKVSPLDKPEGYHLISPLGKIPALTDGDLKLADSSIICDYLNNQYGNNELYPTDPALRAQALWFEEYADSKLLDLLGTLFFERVLKPKFRQEPPNEQNISNILEQLPAVFDYLESSLPDSGFIFSKMSIADIAIGTQFINAGYAQFKLDSEKWPKLGAYLEMLLQQPCFVKRMAEDAKLFA